MKWTDHRTLAQIALHSLPNQLTNHAIFNSKAETYIESLPKTTFWHCTNSSKIDENTWKALRVIYEQYSIDFADGEVCSSKVASSSLDLTTWSWRRSRPWWLSPEFSRIVWISETWRTKSTSSKLLGFAQEFVDARKVQAAVSLDDHQLVYLVGERAQGSRRLGFRGGVLRQPEVLEHQRRTKPALMASSN